VEVELTYTATKIPPFYEFLFYGLSLVWFGFIPGIADDDGCEGEDELTDICEGSVHQPASCTIKIIVKGTWQCCGFSWVFA
jgi:hypothetical protein